MAGFVAGAPKNNLRLAISILGGCSKNIKTRRSLDKKLKNLYQQYCSTRLYSTNIAAIKANEHMVVHSSYPLASESATPSVLADTAVLKTRIVESVNRSSILELNGPSLRSDLIE